MSTAPVLNHREQNVIFRLGEESYGIDIFRVHEIIRLREITPIPGSEPHIRGLVNLRGKTIPVVDLRTKFGLPPAEDTESTRIIVVESDRGNVGIVVDAVTEVVTVEPDQVDATPPLVANVTAEFVRGIAKQEAQLITLLNLEQAIAA
ncbi:MAG: chemotaxis protein CheW [Armatimonadetes bacterium]|jgi:purine-binding chemotaxis protein CheW|nr:chemotaxis protein CheW [Armatimonadota bacterium]